MSSGWPGPPNLSSGSNWPGAPNPSSGPGMPAWPGAPNPSSGPGMPAWPGAPNPCSGPGMPAWPGAPNPSSGSAWPGAPNPSSGPAWPGAPNPSSASGTQGWPSAPPQSGGPASQGWPSAPPQSGGPGDQGWSGGPKQPNQYPPGPGWPSCGPAAAPAIAQQNLSVPFDHHLPRGIYENLCITINGTVNPRPNKITLNLCAADDIAFHFNPRFNEGGRKVIVSNSFLQRSWGPEERPQCFPFTPGKQFQMKIICSREGYEVMVDNKQVLKFKHRKWDLSNINKLSIYDDVTLFSVNIN